MKDYYNILGLQHGASDKEIKSAYRKLSKKFHPDVNDQDVFFERMFKDIQEAFEVLSDPIKKANYEHLHWGKKASNRKEPINQQTTDFNPASATPHYPSNGQQVKKRSIFSTKRFKLSIILALVGLVYIGFNNYPIWEMKADLVIFLKDKEILARKEYNRPEIGALFRQCNVETAALGNSKKGIEKSVKKWQYFIAEVKYSKDAVWYIKSAELYLRRCQIQINKIKEAKRKNNSQYLSFLRRLANTILLPVIALILAFLLSLVRIGKVFLALNKR